MKKVSIILLLLSLCYNEVKSQFHGELSGGSTTQLKMVIAVLGDYQIKNVIIAGEAMGVSIDDGPMYFGFKVGYNIEAGYLISYPISIKPYIGRYLSDNGSSALTDSKQEQRYKWVNAAYLRIQTGNIFLDMGGFKQNIMFKAGINCPISFRN